MTQDPLTFAYAFLNCFFRRPYQYLEEAAPDSGKWMKEHMPLTYFYLSGRPINNLLRHLLTDVFVVSYPKCGRTWLRLLIGKYLAEHYDVEQDNLMNLKELSKKCDAIPRMKMTHEDDPHYRSARTLAPQKQAFRGKTVVFLVRDPRDVVVSRFHHVRSREGREDRVGTLSDFIRYEPDGFRTIVRYYNVWLANADLPRDFLLVRYEDMQEDTGRELKRVLRTLRVPDVRELLVKEAVEFCRFEKMRKMEEREVFDSGALQKGESDSEQSYKTRKGEVGGFHEEVHDELIERMNHFLTKELHPRFGYTPDDGSFSRPQAAD